MNDELVDILEQERRYALDAQAADETEAAAARVAGDMPRAFDLSIYLALADVSWALEDWGQARRWYDHNADVLGEARAWHRTHSGGDYPLEASSDWEAATLVKSGRVDEARDRLTDAIAYRKEQPGSELVVANLALHAAQIGCRDFMSLVQLVVASRQVTGDVDETNDDLELRLVRAQLHYEPAQARLLLGDWGGFRVALQQLEDATRLINDPGGRAHPREAQRATTAAARGFRAISSIQDQTIDPAVGVRQARRAFEDAMLAFYRAAGWLTGQLYFMRLNVLLAEQLAEGQPLEPNPFADRR